jgi:two-component system chemotaxis response regulator CheB
VFVGEHTRTRDVVVVSGSAGALGALCESLSALPCDFPAPVVVQLHRGVDSPDAVSSLLRRRLTTATVPATSGDPLDVPGVRVVPPAHVAWFEDDGTLTVADGQQGDASDRLFESAARVFGDRVCAVVLSGRLRDGARGVRAVKRHGGRVLVQDPGTSRYESMPTHSIATGCVDLVLPARVIGAALVALVMAPGMRDFLHVPTPAWATLV